MTVDHWFDIDAIPFSYRGSWLNLSRIIGKHLPSKHVHLISHRTGLSPVLRLRVDETRQINETPSSLTWRTTGGTVQAAFEAPGRLRIRGHNAGLTIEDAQPNTEYGGSFQYEDPADESVVFSSNVTGFRYRIAALEGDRTKVSDPDGRHAWRFSGDVWEIAIDEFQTTPSPLSHLSFTQVVAAASDTFSEYLDAVAPWRTKSTRAAESAAYLLWASTVEPYGYLERESILMSKHWMDRVWSWDHCFNALALAPGLPSEAISQYLIPFDHQDRYGGLPDMVGPTGLHWAFVKPPVHGWTVSRLVRDIPNLNASVKTQILDGLAALTEFWLGHRRAPGHPVPYYLHGNDSGWDNSTAFTDGETVESPDLTAMLVTQLEAMITLGTQLDDPRTTKWSIQQDELKTALRDQFFVDGKVIARKLDGQHVGENTLLRLVAILAGEQLPADVREALIKEVPQFLTWWGLATEKPRSAAYEEDGYWRGPIWAPTTVLIEDGLRRSGATELADTISDRFRELCEKSGFAENFDAITGAGLRDRAYTWTASCYLILAREYEHRRARTRD